MTRNRLHLLSGPAGAFLFLCGAPLPAQESAPTLHALLIIDNLDAQIGASVVKDKEKWQRLFKEVTGFSELNLSYKEKIVEGAEFSDTAIQEAIDSLEVGTNDVIAFCYGGHGLRFEGMKYSWPALKVNKKGNRMDEVSWDLVDIFKQLQSKNPRLLLVLADCCNNVIPERWEKYYPMHSRSAVPRRLLSGQYRKLFIDYRGSFIAAGSSPGEFSWGSSKGGYFTEYFINALHDTAEDLSQDPSWSTIFKEGTKLIEQVDSAGKKTVQQPMSAENPAFE